ELPDPPAPQQSDRPHRLSPARLVIAASAAVVMLAGVMVLGTNGTGSDVVASGQAPDDAVIGLAGKGRPNGPGGGRGADDETTTTTEGTSDVEGSGKDMSNGKARCKTSAATSTTSGSTTTDTTGTTSTTSTTSST